jgi:hypothetical protein
MLGGLTPSFFAASDTLAKNKSSLNALCGGLVEEVEDEGGVGGGGGGIGMGFFSSFGL